MKRRVILTFLFMACFVFISCEPQERTYEGDLYIQGRPGLKFASKFESITGDLVIDQDDLVFWDAYNGFTAPSWIWLNNVDDLKNLTHVGGNVTIRRCPQLKNLNGLKNLQSIDGELSIHENSKLENLDGLQNLTSVGDNMEIRTCPQLTSIAGLKKLTSVGGLYISNTAIASLNLDNLCFISGDEYNGIKNNPNLCNNLISDLINQVETCPGGELVGNMDTTGNKDCSTP